MEQQQPKKKRRIWLWIVVGFVGICIIGALAGKDDTKIVSKDGKQVESNEDEKTAKIGDKVQVGDWEYIFTSAKTAKTVKGLMGNEKPDADQFIVVKVKVTNIGKDKCTLSENFFKLKDKNGAEYDTSTKTMNEMMLKPLNPHGSFTGEIAFEVPNGKVGDFKLEADGGFSSSSKVTVELA